MILLIGGGFMGKEYIKSLIRLDEDFVVVVKSENQLLKDTYPHVKIISGGIDNFIENTKEWNFKSCIIATPIQFLEDNLEKILERGTQNVLIEKPGGTDNKKMKKIIDFYPDRTIVVAYNRRFYDTVEKAKEIIEEDGGVSSFSMQITELIHRIDPDKYDKLVLENWFISMTTHLVDMAFYLCGEPTFIESYTGPGKDWYKTGVYVGCGKTEKGALFSYHGDWNSAGRWRLEICTKNHLLLFYPLEKLQIQKNGSMEIETIVLTEENTGIKKGIFEQTLLFLQNPKNEQFLTYDQQIKRLQDVYGKITGIM